MQFGLLFSTLAVAQSVAGPGSISDYATWKSTWGITYNGDEDVLRESVFNVNTAAVVAQNAKYTAGEDSWWAVQNQFTALTAEEFTATYLNFDAASQSILNQSTIPVELAEYAEAEAGNKDWPTSPVKDQGSCGSCWAFGAVAGMESEVRRQLSRSDILSEQQVMDCTSSNACSGGRADSAYPQLYGKALYTLASYGYQARQGSCHTGTDSGVRISTFTRTSRPVSDSGLASALDTAAQVVAVGASSWSSYGGGVYTGSTSCSLNHQVQATGYDSSSFKVKNSWGKSWGESGYIRLARTSSGCGTSGILSDGGFYPKMSTASVEV